MRKHNQIHTLGTLSISEKIKGFLVHLMA